MPLPGLAEAVAKVPLPEMKMFLARGGNAEAVPAKSERSPNSKKKRTLPNGVLLIGLWRSRFIQLVYTLQIRSVTVHRENLRFKNSYKILKIQIISKGR